MKTKILFTAIISLIMVGLTSCEQDYACESYWGESGHYNCENNDGMNCKDGDKYAPAIRQKYYSGLTCQEIGYTSFNSYHKYISPSGETYAGSGSLMNDSGNSGSCTSSYNGPSTTTYPQTAVFCYQAWYYRCSAGLPLESQQVSTNCETYKLWRENNPNLPECSYCK